MRDQLWAHLPALRRYARMLTGDAWASDDLIQDTLERACSKWTLWTANSNLRAWLFTLMHNVHISQIRQRRYHPPPVMMQDADACETELISPPDATDERLDLQACLMRLPDDQRQVLLLVTLEAMSYQDVATTLGVPVGTVMSRLHRARARLRELMAMPSQASTSTEAQTPVPRMRRLK